MTPLPKNLRPTTLEEALGVIAQLLQIIAEQQARIVALEARVADLEGRLGQNSQNSSRPPRRIRRPWPAGTGRRPSANPAGSLGTKGISACSCRRSRWTAWCRCGPGTADGAAGHWWTRPRPPRAIR